MSKRIHELLAEAERQKHASDAGGSSVTSASRPFSHMTEADGFFATLRQELFRVEDWNGKTALTTFELFDGKGNLPGRSTAVVGDFIRLTMRGSGKKDWVRVIDIIDEPGEAIVSIKPAHDPTETVPDEKATSHFFTSESTNNLCLEKDEATVSFYVIGLSEKTNTGEAAGLIEKARNVAVSNLGYYLGIQKAEWKNFCKNFLRLTEKE